MIRLKSQSSSNSESESDDLAPPPLKLPKVVSRGSKSKTTVRYHNGKRGNYGARKNYTAKHSWLAPDIDGNRAFCKFCKKHHSGSRGLPKGSDGTFITKPFTKWSKGTGCTVREGNKEGLVNGNTTLCSSAGLLAELIKT